MPIKYTSCCCWLLLFFGVGFLGGWWGGGGGGSGGGGSGAIFVVVVVVGLLVGFGFVLFLHFIAVLAAIFCTACRLIAFWGSCRNEYFYRVPIAWIACYTVSRFLCFVEAIHTRI